MSYCCINGCNNRYTPGGTIRFYRIPSGRRQFQIYRRRLWMDAIQQANGSSEEISSEARICGAHFITGEASTDPDRPNFVPTLFLCTKLRQSTNKNANRVSGLRQRRQQQENVGTKTTTTRREDAKTRSQTMLAEHAVSEKPTTPIKNAKTANTTTPIKNAKTANTTTPIKNAKTANTTTVTEDEETKNKTTLIEHAEMQMSSTQPASESSTLMETGDEQITELQASLCTSVSKEEEMEDKKIHNKEQSGTKMKTEAETIKPENKSSLKIPPHYRNILKLGRRNPIVLLKPLVLPQDVYQVDLSSQAVTEASNKEHEEENTCETVSAESSLVTKDQPSFPCNLCDRNFTTSHYLKRHKLLHVRDVRKCLRCGALFCRRHNHVFFQTRAEPLPEFEEGSSSSEDEPLKSTESTEKGQTSKTTEMPDKTLSIQTNAPPNNPSVTKSVPTTTPPTNLRKPLLESVKPAAVPSPPSPIFKVPNNQGTVFQIKPILSECSPTLLQPNLQQPQLPSSLKIFSAQHLTSALLDVQRNYKYILGKSKKEVKIKEELEELVQICPVEEPVRHVKLEKIAYDLEMLI